MEREGNQKGPYEKRKIRKNERLGFTVMIKQNKHFCHLIRGEGILPKIFAETHLKISAEGEFGGRVNEPALFVILTFFHFLEIYCRSVCQSSRL